MWMEGGSEGKGGREFKEQHRERMLHKSLITRKETQDQEVSYDLD